jgi:hypothetical protein
VLLKEGKVTRRSIKEYAEALKARYSQAAREKKGKILDEFTQVTGLHRKAAIRLLHRQRQPGLRGGRPPLYGKKVAEALRIIWEASDRLCSRRLQPFIPEMIRALRKHGEQVLDAATEAELCRISSSTIDRLLRPYRKLGGRKPISTTRPGSLLKNAIPIRTFADWDEDQPGFMEVDLVAHCGDSTEGFYLNTLCGVDVDSGWTECLPVWGKYQERVRQSVHYMKQRIPFALLGIDSDNGSEFINQCFYKYCRDEKITFTRSRSYKKNDSCHVEQKNGNIVRRFVGYERYATKVSFDWLKRVYELVRLYINFFQPTMKLQSKTRHGARVYKVYDTAQTPYQRLLQSGVLTAEKKTELAATYQGLNPVRLLTQINENLVKLWRTGERPNQSGNHNYDANKRPSVTV